MSSFNIKLVHLKWEKEVSDEADLAVPVAVQVVVLPAPQMEDTEKQWRSGAIHPQNVEINYPYTRGDVKQKDLYPNQACLFQRDSYGSRLEMR